MGNSKNNEYAILKRRQKVAEYYLQGKTQFQISEIFRVNQSTICKDLKAIREQWLSKMLASFDQKKCEELAKVDRLETVAWDAWYESCRKAKEIQKLEEEGETEKGYSKKTSKRTILRGQTGDPRFLEIISKCIQTRMKVMGLFNDTIVQNNNNVVVNWDSLLNVQDNLIDPVQSKLEEIRSLPLEHKVIENGSSS